MSTVGGVTYAFLAEAPVWNGSRWVGGGLGIVRVLPGPPPTLQLTPVGFLDTPGYPFGVAVARVAGTPYAFVADGDSGLRIINVSNPALPVEVGFLNTIGWARGVVMTPVAGVPYAFVADGNAGLRIVNVSNPAAPVGTGFYDTPGWAESVAVGVVGVPYAFVADGSAGLRIINVAAPALPFEAGFYDGELERWHTEQWHTMPDRYTELALPAGQKYLLTSDWLSDQSRVSYYGCDPGFRTQDELSALRPDIPRVNIISTSRVTCTWVYNITQTFFAPDAAPPTLPMTTTWAVTRPLRVKFLYEPGVITLSKDLYVNTWVSSVTPTPTPTPTRTPTPPPGTTGTITGTVRLQGRTNHAGAAVSTGALTTTTDSNGNFTLTGVPAGTRVVTASMRGYLYAQRTGVVVGAGTTTALPTVQLLGGDADGDCNVDLFDLVMVSGSYGSTPPSNPYADINGNGTVDIFDLVMVGVNLDKTCPGAWTAPIMPGVHAAEAAHLRVSPEQAQGRVGDLLTVTLEVADVSNLYGADVQLTFDPAALEVVDVDPSREGVQITRGTFPDPAYGEVAKDEADNVAGTVRYAITLKSPAPPASGSGRLCAISFRPKALGVSPLQIIYAELTDAGATVIPVLRHNGSVSVGLEYRLSMPLVVKTGGHR